MNTVKETGQSKAHKETRQKVETRTCVFPREKKKRKIGEGEFPAGQTNER